MKKFLSILAVASLLTTSGVYAKGFSNKELLKKIEALEAQLKALKKDTQEQLDDINERVDDNEFEASSNRIKWGGGIEMTDSNFKGTTGSITGMRNGRDYTNNNKLTTKLKLTMDANINEKTKFHGRLSMYKNWADSTASTMIQDPSEGKNSNSGTSGLFVERAYIDYKINKTFTLTIGRQPSSDGPGLSLINNTPRQATYPALLFDGNADGIVLTAKTGSNKAFKHTKFRIAYGKGFQKDDNQNGFLANENGIKDLNVLGAFYEGKLNIKGMGPNLFVLSYVKATDFVGNAKDTNDTNNKNLGDINLAGLYFENNHAFGTNLNYFFSLGMSDAKSNGKSYLYNGRPMKLIDGKGYAYQIGFRYDVTKKFKFGYEFNHGSKKWFSFTQGSEDPMNKLATRGDVHDVYGIYQMDMNQFVRIGYTDIKYDYTGSGWHIGTPMKTDDKARRLYITYNIKF